ncbi:MAG: hypothetical protein MZV70_73035 [Desulfobacterales bacterium]|nr:hypothetical protein [Desulfobacterales bacterium]
MRKALRHCYRPPGDHLSRCPCLGPPVLLPGPSRKIPPDIAAKACSACHDTGKVCKYLGKKDKEAWLKVVNGMVSKRRGCGPGRHPPRRRLPCRSEPGSKPV